MILAKFLIGGKICLIVGDGIKPGSVQGID